mmetsp:Transcript_29230/g.46946  ORF Transcript_29230/g.46946 Transcript_29230/m.46946 type:complete len:177 (+) Transcript_29230:394-924(+)
MVVGECVLCYFGFDDQPMGVAALIWLHLVLLLWRSRLRDGHAVDVKINARHIAKNKDGRFVETMRKRTWIVFMILRIKIVDETLAHLTGSERFVPNKAHERREGLLLSKGSRSGSWAAEQGTTIEIFRSVPCWFQPTHTISSRWSKFVQCMLDHVAPERGATKTAIRQKFHFRFKR